MRTPSSRGAYSAALIARLTGAQVELEPWQADGDVLDNGDFQLALWVLYELHYRGFDDSVNDAEWDPALLAARRDLESHFDAALHNAVDPQVNRRTEFDDVTSALTTLIEDFDGTSLPTYLKKQDDAQSIREVIAQRSVLQLKEADPYTWVIPRLSGAAKVALVELQYDEYGDGRAERLHQDLYARAMADMGLDPTYGAYIDRACPQMLALANAASYFGLHRRLRGAAMGHLAAFESTSSLPSRQYAELIRAADLGDTAAYYFDEHVEADAIHEQMAIHDICGQLVEQERELSADVMVGAATCLVLDDRFARAFIDLTS